MESTDAATAPVSAPALSPELQTQFDGLLQNPDFKRYYDHQLKGEAPVKETPKTFGGVSPEVQAILDQMLPQPKEVAMADPTQQLTGQQLLDYQRQVNHRQKLLNFQNEMRGLFTKPLNVNGVTLDMSDPARSQQFMNFAKDFVSRVPTAQEIVKLHFFDQLMAGARTTAGRRAEDNLQRRAVRTPAEVERRVVTPEPTPTPTTPGRVPTLLEMAAQKKGQSGDQFMNAWKMRTLNQ